MPEGFSGLIFGAEVAGQFGLAEQPEGKKKTISIAAPLTVHPREPVYLHGPLNSAAPPPKIAAEDFKHIAPLSDSQKASTGILLDLGGEEQILSLWLTLLGNI